MAVNFFGDGTANNGNPPDKSLCKSAAISVFSTHTTRSVLLLSMRPLDSFLLHAAFIATPYIYLGELYSMNYTMEFSMLCFTVRISWFLLQQVGIAATLDSAVVTRPFVLFRCKHRAYFLHLNRCHIHGVTHTQWAHSFKCCLTVVYISTLHCRTSVLLPHSRVSVT